MEVCTEEFHVMKPAGHMNHPSRHAVQIAKVEAKCLNVEKQICIVTG
jgi:hypothetical protein